MTELEKLIERWELKLEPVEHEPLAHKWATEITAQDLRLFVDAAKRLKELEKERDELKRTIDTITTDENYVGGVQYWIRKHDKRLGENIEVCAQLSEILTEYKNALVVSDNALQALRELVTYAHSKNNISVVGRIAINALKEVLSTPTAIAVRKDK